MDHRITLVKANREVITLAGLQSQSDEGQYSLLVVKSKHMVSFDVTQRVVASSVSLDMVEVASSNLAGPTKIYISH